MNQPSMARIVAAAEWLRRRLPSTAAGPLQRTLTWLLRQALPTAAVVPLQCRLEHLLGESSSAARALAYDWFFYKQLEVQSWADGAPPSVAGELRDADRVGRYLDDANRGVIVATIHMGDYLDGLRRLRLATTRRRSIYVVRHRHWSAAEARAFRRVAGDAPMPTVLRTGSNSIAGAVRALRRGAIIVVLFDLPARYGRTTAVQFFGRNARIVRGPAELALVGNADILPLLCHYDRCGRRIAEVCPIIAAHTVPAPGRAAAAAALTQRLCSLAEAHIRRYPGQWAHWPLVDELIDEPVARG